MSIFTAGYPARFNTLAEAESFLRACESDPSASPYNYGAIPPFTSEIRTGGTWTTKNPEWDFAQFEVILFVDHPASSQIVDRQKLKDSRR